MKKNFIISTILAIVLITIFAFGFSFMLDKGITEFNKMEYSVKKEVGEKVVLGKDTLIIVDYKLLSESYVLSNGNRISFDLVDKIKVKNK